MQPRYPQIRFYREHINPDPLRNILYREKVASRLGLENILEISLMVDDITICSIVGVLSKPSDSQTFWKASPFDLEKKRKCLQPGKNDTRNSPLCSLLVQSEVYQNSIVDRRTYLTKENR